MSENKGSYQFGSSKLLNKRLEDLKHAPIPTNHAALKKLTELAIQMADIAQSVLDESLQRPTYTDEEVRELARHLSAVIKAYHYDNSQNRPHIYVVEAEGFLQSKKYFNVNQSDVIV